MHAFTLLFITPRKQIRKLGNAMQVANQGDHFLKCPPLLYSTTSRISALWREHCSAAPQTNPRWRGRTRALVFLPARISRSSWLAGPSCSDVAMFRPEVQIHIDSHWKRLETHDSQITPPPQEISTNSTARTDPSAPNTGNPPRALRYVRFTSTAERMNKYSFTKTTYLIF